MKTRNVLVLCAAVSAACAFVGLGELSAAPSATPSASASAPPAPSAPHGTLATYSWPTTPSDKPKDEEWAHATELEPVVVHIERRWEPSYDVTCEPSVLREWLSMKCTPKGTFFGVVWSVAGALKNASAWFKMRGELGPPQYPDSPSEKEELSMGSYATVTLPVRPGAAAAVAIDQIGWVVAGYGQVVSTEPGILIDVSWASGESSPTIAVR